ncbi:MAG: hypothetical protein ABEK00_01845 [Candidatus Nanohaloarchaea archaeon]
MPKAKPTDFTEETRVLDGEAVKEERLEPVEVLGNEIPALDFDTVVHHLRRNNYDVTVSPNGESLDAEGEAGTKYLDVSALNDDAVQVEFKIDIDEAEARKGEEIENPEGYVDKVYGQVIDELVEREKKIERASENYVRNVLEEDKPVEKLENEFGFYGDTAGEVIDSYFGDTRPSDLFMNYAVHFELHPGETVDNERRNLEGKMPLHYAEKDWNSENDRNRLYLQRYLSKVLEKAGEELELSDDLKSYWQGLQ